tara:strand:+ start:317 stop:541 length:225 start_codon:yes stop_codon:yes gene_type:complete
MDQENKKTYLLDITGICVEEDEIENTTIHVCRNGEWCEIPWDKNDIVGTHVKKQWSLCREIPWDKNDIVTNKGK